MRSNDTVSTKSCEVTANRYLIAVIVIFAEISAEIVTYLYTPSFPFIAYEFSVTESQVQFTVQLALFFFGLSSIFYGGLSRVFGYRQLFLIGIAISICGNFFSFIAYNIETLCMARAVKAIGASAILVLSRIVIVETYKKEKELARIFSFLLAAPALEIFLAPLGGYIASSFEWRFVFTLPLFMEICTFFMAFLFLKEIKQPLHFPAQLFFPVIWKEHFNTLKSPIFLKYSVIYALVSSIYWSYLLTAPFLFHSLGISGEVYGFYIASNTVGYLIGTLTNQLLIRHFGSQKLLVTGVVILFLVSIIFSLITVYLPYSSMALSISFGGVTFCMALIYPNATQNAMLSSTYKKTASALMTFIDMSFVFVITTLLKTQDRISRESISLGLLFVTFISLGLLGAFPRKVLKPSRDI